MTINLFNSTEFINALKAKDKPLAQVYSMWLENLFKSPLWDPIKQDGMRIPWKCRCIAQEYMGEIFGKKGIYIFGTKENEIRYIGITSNDERNFKKRLARYIPTTKRGQKSQCRLAEKIQYKGDLYHQKFLKFREECAKGTIPMSEIKKNYHNLLQNAAKKYLNGYIKINKPRCIGAVDFAWHGINGIWFTLLVVNDQNDIKKLETELIPIADIYNSKKGHLPLNNEKP